MGTSTRTLPSTVTGNPILLSTEENLITDPNNVSLYSLNGDTQGGPPDSGDTPIIAEEDIVLIEDDDTQGGPPDSGDTP